MQKTMGLDLLFLLDVTVSMQPYRDGVVKQMKQMISILEVSSYPGVSIGCMGNKKYNTAQGAASPVRNHHNQSTQCLHASIVINGESQATPGVNRQAVLI